MRVQNAAASRPWRRKVISGTLIVLGLAGIGLSDSQAQMSYSGGFVPNRRNRSPYTLGKAPVRSTASKTPSYFPDNDFYFRSFFSAAASATRSYYPETAARSSVGDLPFGVSAAALPWNQAGFEKYKSSPSALRKYALEATLVPRKSAAGKSDTALLIVHLPEQAMLWVEGRRTPLRGPTSYFRSPPLSPAKKYIYTLRAEWFENGHWVKQTREVPVAAGAIQAVYLRPSPPLPGAKNPEDRETKR